MAVLSRKRPAFGAPGIEPRWTRSAKDAVGTAYSTSSRVWFTCSVGVINEAYYPTIDRPQIRDLQYLVTDGATFCHDERRHLDSTTEWLSRHTLGVKLTNRDRDGRYTIVKEIISDPHAAALLVRTRISGRAAVLRRLRLFALLAPHLGVSGRGNSGYVAQLSGRDVLVATKNGVWLALAATVPFRRCSCGYVGVSDGWTDLMDNCQMDWTFDVAEDGNIALTGELDLREVQEFTLGLAFGDTLQSATTTLLQSLGFPFNQHRAHFAREWARAGRRIVPLAKGSGDRGALYRASHSLLLAHEDKTYPGAMIASLSIPWGEAKGDEDLGGYHLVWTRDMVNSATALLAAGNVETPLRALIYLACTQRVDGGFCQNFWINGEPYWRGIQLDEVAFPILLAWKLARVRALRDFDPLPLVIRAVAYLIREGCVTGQERWEENAGYSPSTLAAVIAALTCAAEFLEGAGEKASARFVQEHADFLESHLEDWTVTRRGTVVPGIPRHFIRINPVDPGDPVADEDPDHGTVTLRNRGPGARAAFPASEIVDGGFLELVRYGIRKADDPLIEDSVRVVDAMLRVETPFGPCWHRYNHDGYGQADDGGPYTGWGRGRAWPLLTGERGHYEVAAGHDAAPYIRAMERFATSTGLLPEQVWDEPDRPQKFLFFGRPTGSAMPLMWAHAEYVKLLRSTRDGTVFDFIPAVAQRYQRGRRRPPEVWKFNRQPRSVPAGAVLRVQASAPFMLHWTLDEWQHATDSRSCGTVLGIEFVDLAIPVTQRGKLRFTFFWPETGSWEGRDFDVECAVARSASTRPGVPVGGAVE
jgi:glucoamylase